MEKVNLAEKLSRFDEHWSPKIVATMNTYDIQLVKVLGEFVWHQHDDTDDFFLVLKGKLTVQLRDGNVELGPASYSSCREVSSTAPGATRRFICC